jgi:N-acetyl-gamma-glutamyl-phosphate reductase
MRPLIDAGLLPVDLALSIHGVTGYSGGGKPMIEKWESPVAGLVNLPFESPYALDKKHKHIPEMQRYGRLKLEPQFRPAVAAFRCGMRIEIPLHVSDLPMGVTGESIINTYRGRYADEQFIRVVPIAESSPSHERTFDPQTCNGTNRVELRVVPHPSGHLLLIAILDNLGKGASGAAVQSLNLMLGLPEATGLRA